MEEKSRKTKNGFNPVVTIGIVGHCPIETLQELKHALEELDSFNLIFFKTSSGRLWIQEGDESIC